MKLSLLSASGLFLATTLAYAQDDPVIYFDAAKPQFVDNEVIVLDGVRVEGFGLSAESDAVRLEYRFDLETLNFVLDNEALTIYDEIGMFYDHFMAIDVENVAPPFVANGEIFVQSTETSYEFSATDSEPFVAEMVLEAGHVITWYLSRVRSDYLFAFTGPNMNISGEGTRGQNRLFEPVKIMAPGTYRLEIKPIDPEDTKLAFNINTHNNNSKQLLPLSDGDKLDERATRNTKEYSKYLVTIPPEATLTLAAPRREEVRIALVNRQGQLIHEIIGEEAFSYTETANRPQTYYLFIDSGSLYRSDVDIVLPEPPEEEGEAEVPTPDPDSESTLEPETPAEENPSEPEVDENIDEPIFDDEPAELEDLGTGV